MDEEVYDQSESVDRVPVVAVQPEQVTNTTVKRVAGAMQKGLFIYMYHENSDMIRCHQARSCCTNSY